jgi:hypothetical protein
MYSSHRAITARVSDPMDVAKAAQKLCDPLVVLKNGTTPTTTPP